MYVVVFGMVLIGFLKSNMETALQHGNAQEH